VNEATLRRLWITTILVFVGLIVAASLSPAPVIPSQSFPDKTAHFLAYFSLALLGSGITTPARLWRTLLKCFLLGAALEIAQELLTDDHRTADMRDLAANTAGILAAWLVAAQGRSGWGLRAFAWVSRRRAS
jgi:VanZ family protein